MMYAIISSIIFIVLAVIWTKKDALNFFIKLAFIGMAIWGAVASNVLTLNI